MGRVGGVELGEGGIWTIGKGIVLVIFFFFSGGVSSNLKKSRMATTGYLVIESSCAILPSIILYITDSATYRKKLPVGLLCTQGDTDTGEKSGYTLYGGPHRVHTKHTLLPLCQWVQLQSRL